MGRKGDTITDEGTEMFYVAKKCNWCILNYRTMKKTVYIIGHRNPDTDSVFSAASYAYLKQMLEGSHYKAARAGQLPPQTEYVFNRFNVPIPEYVPELLPKVQFFMERNYQTADENASLWKAVSQMESKNLPVVPIVDSEGKYHSLLHDNALFQSTVKQPSIYRILLI